MTEKEFINSIAGARKHLAVFRDRSGDHKGLCWCLMDYFNEGYCDDENYYLDNIVVDHFYRLYGKQGGLLIWT